MYGIKASLYNINSTIIFADILLYSNQVINLNSPISNNRMKFLTQKFEKPDVKRHILTSILLLFFLNAFSQRKTHANGGDGNDVIAQNDSKSKFYAPIKRITSGPGFHWFAYYDKLQCDPSSRYVLGMKTSFEHRSPTKDDVLEIGMVDLQENCKWIKLGESRAWGWQQGCQLQFIPGSKNEIIWNDRDGDNYVSRIMNIETRKTRTIQRAIYALSPDGKWAVTTDYRRITHPGYNYAGISDPNKDVLVPKNTGIWKVNLQTGKTSLIISIADIAAIPNPYDKAFSQAKNWLNHLLINPDGTRFVFLHRWTYPDAERSLRYEKIGGFGTRMITASMDGKDMRVIDPYSYTSHFIWQNPNHILAWTRIPNKGDGFFIFNDSSQENIKQIGKDVMTVNGHCTYLPGNEWILNDTYPDKETRLQSVYLYHVKTGKRVPLADLYSPAEYKGEWRCDTHPRATSDGKYVIVDSPNWEGRQMYMIDIQDIVKHNKE